MAKKILTTDNLSVIFTQTKGYVDKLRIVSRVSARDISDLLAKDKSVDVVPGVIVSFFNTETNAWEGWQFNCPPDLQEIERYDVMEFWKKVW